MKLVKNIPEPIVPPPTIVLELTEEEFSYLEILMGRGYYAQDTDITSPEAKFRQAFSISRNKVGL